MTEANPTPAAKKSFIQRMIGAAMLDVPTFEEVEHDLEATPQAGAVVVIVALCAAIGGARSGLGGAIGLAGLELAGWLTWAAVTYLIGTRLFDGEATWGELLRTLGFAKSPGVLLLIASFPILGPLAAAAAGIWTLIAGIIAIRQALDVKTSEALITAFLGWLVYVAMAWVLALLIGIPAAILSSFL